MAKREIESVPLSRFGVLVAQLESIAAAARQQPPDPLLCFDLLSELVTAIEEEPKECIVQWQRKCEEALYSFLILGARRPVRRLASSAMGRVIAKGDGISIYSRASSLQGWLADGKRSEPLSCAGAAQCLGELYRLFGRRITSGLVETTNIAAKLMKFHEDFVRQDAQQMLENALEGSGGSGASTAYSEAFRIIMRNGVNDKSSIVRRAAARCLKTFASIGGPGLGITDLENSISHCVKGLEDPVSSVRDAFAEALGALLALAMNPEAQRGKNHSVPAKKLEDGLQKHLVSPFIRASGFRAKDLRIGLALSWVFFLQAIRLKYHLPDSELQNFASQAMDMLQRNVSVDAHSLACVLYVLRVGVTDQMTEPIQRSFLVYLGRKLESADYSPSVGVATLRILSYLLKTLGEVPVEFKDVLDNTVVAALSHSSLPVRIEAALTLRALAEVDPTCVGGLVSYGVATLHALRESASIEKGNHLSLELDSLHGQAAVLAALVFISPKLQLGYPARLPKSVFGVSKKMLTEFSRNPVAATVEKESGWMLLASLIASMPKEELEDQVFDVLLLWADPFVGNPESYIKQTQDLALEICVLSVAIEALTAFIRSFVSPNVAANNGGVLLQPVLTYLRWALSYISSLAAKPTLNLKPALDIFTIRTLMAYQSISNPVAYKSEFPQIMQICTTPFSDPSGSEESSCLRVLLDKRDACLGPWIPGRDWFEDELRAFDGGKDGLMPCVWEDEHSSFPQPESISKMLVNQKLLCFGTIFASQDDGGRMTLLSKIDQCLKTGRKQSWHIASTTNACVALLAGLKAVLALRPQTLGTEILSSVQSIFQSTLAEGEICSAQRRAACEGLGLLARLGNDMFTARMMRTLLGELVAAADPSYIGSIALSLGCIHRSAGGMALSSLVPATVSSISSLAKASNAGLQLWALHALLLTIEAAGLSYISQVQATLFLAMEILLTEENGLADLRQEIGRLINAIVAVLGPELSPGSTFFSRCKSVIAELSSCQETSTLLESVRFTQQLVLFAPQAVSVHSHVQSLLPTLASRQPSLRNLAVSTLRHLIEKDPVAMIEEKIEENLFCMLDEETDAEIGRLIRTTITRLLYASCPSFPSRWLAILHSMIVASTARRNALKMHGSSENDHTNSTFEGDARLYHGEDDEDMIASPNGEQITGSESIFAVGFKRDKHLRYRTRVFAAECLSYVPTAVGTNPAHFDLSLARKQTAKGHTSPGDWLVLHLQELVSLSYQISTSQFEGMQPIGVRLLSIIIDKYEKIPDPELPGHLLLEQYQAQFVSAVRSAISMSSGPLLLEAGLQLATQILTSSIISGDRVALNRMFSLISHPLNDIKDLCYPSFAEWVACKIKVRLLAAHASIKCYVYQFLEEQDSIPDEYLQLIPLLSSSSSILAKYWISLLRDYIYICFSLHSKSNYKPFLDGIQSSSVSSKVQKCLDEAWPLILRATALDAVPVNFEKDTSTSFISGYSMVRLEISEFQFLWGLTLLVIFQCQQPVMDAQVKKLVINIKNKHDGDSFLEETYDLVRRGVALPAIKYLLKEVFFSQEFLALELCMEIIQVLVYTDDMSDSWNSLVICILSQVVLYCPDVFFEAEDFTAMATELCFKHLFITFQSNEAMPQDDPNDKGLLYKLSMVAETLARRMSKKNQWKLMVAFMSASYEWFQMASSKSCLSKVITFLQNILPFLKKYVRDEAELDVNGHTHLETILRAWCSMLVCLSQDCIKRTHNMETRMSESSKLLAKILAFCQEEAVALARLVHETQNFEKKENLLLFVVFKQCAICIRDVLCDTNIKVKLVGLHVLKSMAQRELAEGSHVKNRSFFLFFFGEILVDIFVQIQLTLKESLSKESLAVTEECLRLLFLFSTLAQGSDHLQEVTGLLLEALLMVFSVSSESLSQEVGDVKAIVRRLVSHFVQIPSYAIQLKEVLLSMPVTRRQQIQDMIRASVDQGQTTVQVKFSVQPEATATRVGQFDASDSMVVHADERDIKENKDEDDDKDYDDDDDDDWDAFQSLPAADASVSVSDSHVKRTESEAGSAGDSTLESNSPFRKDSHQQQFPHPKASEIATHTQSMETSADKKMVSLDSNELEEPSDPQCFDADGTTESKGDSQYLEFSGPHPLADDSKELHNNCSTDETVAEGTMGCKADGDYTLGSSNPPSDNNDLFQKQHQGAYGDVLSEGDGDGSCRDSDNVLAASSGMETSDKNIQCEGDSELKRKGRNRCEDVHSSPKEKGKESDEDDSHKHYVDVLSAPKDIEEENANVSHKQEYVLSAPKDNGEESEAGCHGHSQ